MKAWIQVPKTNIDYPVVQGQDDMEYVNKNVYGEFELSGAIFLSCLNKDDFSDPYNLVYGHNMKSGMMFGGLKNYLQEGYLESHKYIHFNTIYETRTYEIVAVCLSEVQYQDESSYRYYDFISAKTDQEFQAFIQNVNELAVYGDGNGLTREDKLLTLSTCNSYTEDGRLFLVAKRIK